MTAPRERMLRLLSLLQTGRAWPAAELATAMEVPPRTLRRDLDHLRGLGYPVESSRGPGGNYRLVAGAALPPLMLEHDEAIATVLGLRLAAAGGTGIDLTAESADRAAAKLRRILPPALRRRTDAMLAAVEFGSGEQPRVGPDVLSLLAAAIAARRCLEFAYTAKDGPSSRTVEPMRLVQLGRRWYLYAWDLDRRDWRSFRLDRIDAPKTTEVAFEPRELPVDDVAGHLQERFHSTKSLRITLTLDVGADEAAARLHRVDGTFEALGGDRCRYVAEVDSFEWLAVVLTLTDIGFTVEDPPEFAEYLARVGRRFLGPERHA
ncbi:YafY family protein [Amycolatopsis oliviviridis]|uniref:Transcriptional regulator n=1 Tax=Amycolatopsis oliviviridis TaxID=1471590 RepID=A0ABQ3MD22_9PSEU|nr:YafY family protein [Amycolatopsis oliviviridis]GHH32512.1 transcriptional regulator [Amycolatopsis oliviviridis]